MIASAILSVILVLATPSLVGASCAWVLWGEIRETDSSGVKGRRVGWEVVQSFQSKVACEGSFQVTNDAGGCPIPPLRPRHHRPACGERRSPMTAEEPHYQQGRCRYDFRLQAGRLGTLCP